MSTTTITNIDNIYLASCPYCGTTTVHLLDSERPDGAMRYYASCPRCFASGPENSSPAYAAFQWNLVANGGSHFLSCKR